MKTLNRMNDLEESVRIEGKIELDGQDIFADIDPISLRHRCRYGFPTAEPVPEKHL